MRNKKKCLFFFFIALTTPTFVYSDIPPYVSTENVGQNKKERIDSVEKYLIDLSVSLHNMEAKIDESAKKIKNIDDAVKQLKDLTNKKEQSAQDEKKSLASKEARVDKAEIDKLKEDILHLKNNDIEKLKLNFNELDESVKRLELKDKIH